MIAGNIGKYPAQRWIKIIEPDKEETRTPEEIIEQIKSKAAALKGGN